MVHVAGSIDPSLRRSAYASLAGAVVATGLFCWLVTGGTFDFFERQPLAIYDAQARALLHGHWYVTPAAASIEGIRTGAHTYLYYGPVPALLRMPVLLATNRLDGRLAQPSMVLAFVLAMLAISRLTGKVRRLAVGDVPMSWWEATAFGAWVFISGAGSILLYLGTSFTVYYEAELWGAALTLLAFDAALGFLDSPSRKRVVVAGLLAGLALLTRGSVGAGAIAVLGLLATAHSLAWWLRRRAPLHVATQTSPFGYLGVRSGKERRQRPTFARPLWIAVVAPVAVYTWINEVKFGTLWSLPLNRQVYTALSASRRAALAANHGSLFGLKFVPTALVQYLRPDALTVHRLFPFIDFSLVVTVLGHVRYDTTDYSSSVTSTMPVFVALSLIGVVAAFRSRRTGLAVLRVFVIGGAVSCIGALTIAFIANRYLSDFFPLLAVSSLGGLGYLTFRLRMHSPVRRRTITAVLALLAVWGVLANVALALQYQRVVQATQTSGLSFATTQVGIDRTLFGNPPGQFSTGPSLPEPGATGNLFALPQCRAFYQSSGKSWHAIERGGTPGHVRLALTFPRGPAGRRLPLLATGTTPGEQDILAVHLLSPGRISFSYLTQSTGTPWIDGPVQHVEPGATYVVDAALDAQIHAFSVLLDGVEVLDGTYFVRPFSRAFVGSNPLRGNTVAQYPGKVTSLGTPTPLCTSLLNRLHAARTK